MRRQRVLAVRLAPQCTRAEFARSVRRLRSQRSVRFERSNALAIRAGDGAQGPQLARASQPAGQPDARYRAQGDYTQSYDGSAPDYADGRGAEAQYGSSQNGYTENGYAPSEAEQRSRPAGPGPSSSEYADGGAPGVYNAPSSPSLALQRVRTCLPCCCPVRPCAHLQRRALPQRRQCACALPRGLGRSTAVPAAANRSCALCAPPPLDTPTPEPRGAARRWRRRRRASSTWTRP